MPIHRVLSSASIIRLMAPGWPSLMATGAPAVLLVRLTAVRLPPKRGDSLLGQGGGSKLLLMHSGFWPMTYIWSLFCVSTRALLAPPGTGMFTIGLVLELA